MTFLPKDVRDHLAGSTSIDDAVGEHIYDGIIPQGVRYEAAININTISQSPEYYLGGEAGTHTTILQIDVWTDGQGGANRANEVAEMVRNRLSGYRGRFGTGCYGTARIQPGGLEQQTEPPFDGSDLHRRRVIMQFEIIHTADVPTLT